MKPGGRMVGRISVRMKEGKRKEYERGEGRRESEGKEVRGG